ncbi:MAG: hypothetical protein GKR89_00020 [Candidatus Latescibacteria bacterium]|nr:hypothetical protein [Candidatus Latescibacterota bacterium]
MTTPFRVALIGHTGHGNYGHGLDMAFVGVDGAEIVALADPDEQGRRDSAEKTDATRTYADFRAMLNEEKPDIAVVASREIGDHLDLVLGCAEAGVHIYLEKPVAASPAQVDQMIAACQQSGSQAVLAYPWRGHPPVQNLAIPLIREGKIGQPFLARIYGMGGAHGGDQLFLDLYPHFFDFLVQLFGWPQWCQAHITQEGRSAIPEDLKPGVEGMGLVAGNGIRAYYAFASDFCADFESYQGDGRENPYRIDFHGTEGTLSLPGPMSATPDIFFHPLTNPGLIGDDRWEVVEGCPPPSDDKWHQAHQRMAQSFMAQLRGEEPEFSLVTLEEARGHLEMALAAHAAHMQGTRVSLPLPDGNNPFDTWS